MSEERKSGKKRGGFIVLLLLVVVALIVVVTNPFEHLRTGGSVPSASDTGEDAVKVISVRTVSSSVSDIQDYIKVNGDVVDTDSVNVYPDVSGTLTTVNVKVGDHVSKDDLLATVDPSKPGTVYKNSRVLAPVSGTVLAVQYSPGATVSPQASLIRIGMLDDLEIEVAIAERYIGKVSPGKTADVFFVAYPNRVFTGTVVRLSPVLNPATRTLTVGIKLDEPSDLVKAGMFPSVIIHTDKIEGAQVIPGSSILYEGDQPYVYIVSEGQTAKRRDIVLGLVVDGVAEIVDGLHPGDQVVTLGHTLLTDGTPVLVVE